MKSRPRNTKPEREAPSRTRCQRVPRINLISERRRYRPSALSLFLALVIVIEVLALQIINSDLQQNRYEEQQLSNHIDRVQQKKKFEIEATAAEAANAEDVKTEIASIDEENQRVQDAYMRLVAPRPDWAAMVQALMMADSPSFQFDKVITQPSGTVVVSATADGPNGIMGFRKYMEGVSHIFELGDMSSEDYRGVLQVNAIIELK